MSQQQVNLTTPAQNKDLLGELLGLAALGQHPLFHRDWIHESFSANQRLSFARATRIVEEGMKRLERHNTWDRKQTALGAFPDTDRRVFIQSFFKMVEYKTLDQLKELH